MAKKKKPASELARPDTTTDEGSETPPIVSSLAGRRTYNVSAEEFIRTWQLAKSAQEVADKLKMPKPIVLARAATYRSDGIRLKMMKRGSKKTLNVTELNRLIEELARDMPEDNSMGNAVEDVPREEVKPKGKK